MTSDTKAKISNPVDYFDTPQSVLRDTDLTRDEKIKVLQSMGREADRKMPPASGGMPSPDKAYNTDDLQLALAQLEAAIDPKTVDDSTSQQSRFQQIMVVTTGDQDLNRDIVDVAYGIAEMSGGKVCLLSVVSPAPASSVIAVGSMGAAVPLVATDNGQILEDRAQQLAELRAENNARVETEMEVRSGQIEDVIVEYADDYSADIIVVGSPNRSWLETLFNPSIARRVTRSAPCPVLVVPQAP